MTFAEYQAAMRRTYKPFRLVNHALGVAGESGEIAELVKKQVFHAVPYTQAQMQKELGDALWYITALAEDHELTLEGIAQANADKLAVRYPDGFVPGGGNRQGAGA